jgi:hypothetical protein
MRLYECEQCKAVNRVSAFRLDMQPVCRACGHEIEDFPFSRQVRGTWKLKGTIFIACLTGAMAAFGVDWLRGRTEIKAASSAAISKVPVAPETPRLSPPPGYTSVDERASVAPPPASPSYSPPSAVRQPNGVLYVDPKPRNPERVAPFSIKTPPSGGGCFVKLLYAGTDESYRDLFINAGSRFETRVALGNYDLKYAIGERWLGYEKALQDEPFWPSAAYYKLDPTLAFSATTVDETEIRYSGAEIELIDQRNGNLRKSAISAAEFGRRARRRAPR